jgi:hypothetical protein
MHENVRYLLELLDTTARTIERQAHRIEQANREDIETLRLMLHELKEIRRSLEPCPPPPPPTSTLATAITFQENPMNPTQAGQTQVFTGTLSPVGSVLAPDAVVTITSNDPAVTPTLDSTQLVVSVTYPTGWTESATTPLAFQYATTSASTSQALSATITPSAPPSNLATGISFAETL